MSDRLRHHLRFGWVVACLLLALGIQLIPGRHNSTASLSRLSRVTNSTLAVNCNVEGRTSSVLSKAIDQIRVGDCVIGRNPLLSEDQRNTVEEVSPATWRHLTLSIEKANGDHLDINLLRP